MQGMIQMIMQQMMTGQMQNNPMMGLFNQMMQGKTPEQQFQTILNSAKSRGIDVNAKMFTEADLRSMGLNIPRQG